MGIIISILLNALSIYIGSRILSGVHITDFKGAIIAGLVLGLANLIVKPILQLLTLPLTILTLGFFLFVVNALVILIVDALVPSFKVDSFFWAFILGLLMMILNLIYQMLGLK